MLERQDRNDTSLVIGPNASLSVKQACWAFGGIAVVAFAIALTMTVMGFWPVLPFAGLEVGAFGAALWVSLRRNRYREELVFAADRVQVRFGDVGRGIAAELDWPRTWTRVELVPGPNRLAPTVLRLMSGGQTVVVGRCLTDEERESLCARIKQLLPPVWRMATTGEPAGNPAERISTEI